MAVRMNSLGELLTRQTSAPAIVVGAIAHAEVAVVAHFAEASGLIAWAAEHLVLIAAGLDPYGVIVVEAGHAESGSAWLDWRRTRMAASMGSRVGCCDARRRSLAALSFRRLGRRSHSHAG